MKPTTIAGSPVQFKASASYSDGSTQDVTASATWASSNTGAAPSPSKGLVTAAAAGSTNITATAGGVTSTNATLNVLSGNETVLHSFGTGSDGANPIPTVIQASDGNFYGTTVIGGANGNGTVFKITPSGTETVLYSFGTGTDGANPYGRPIPASDGNFYAATYYGGANGKGTVYRLTPSGTETVLYSFGAGTDGANPLGLLQASDGNAYGVTVSGGANGKGTVFKITPTGTETVLYSFGAGTDGANPYGSLLQASDGNFYGETDIGGANGKGTVFKITPTGTEAVLYSFGSGNDGANPRGGLIQASDGNFYGTTLNGGVNGKGTVFKIAPTGTETVLWSFGIGTDGAIPHARLIQASDGNFYSTTYSGGTNGNGTVFQLTPGGTERVLYSFGTGGDGANPYAALIQASDGSFYGTTYNGGTNGKGTVFKMN